MTNTTTTRALLDAGPEIEAPTAARLVGLVGIERRVRCFPLRFRSTTSGSSQIASGIVDPDAVRTASVYVEESPVVHGTSSTPDATEPGYRAAAVGRA